MAFAAYECGVSIASKQLIPAAIERLAKRRIEVYICNGILAAVLSSTLVYAQTIPVPETTRVRLVKEIRHELVTLPYLDVFDDINFQIDGGTITLLGQVTRPTLKTEAENVVKELEGVTNVVNRIEVLPLSPNDDRLRRALYRAIYGSSTLFRYAMPVIKPIRIIVKNGNVALEGVVDTQSDKDMAGLRAKGVSGGFAVVNNLRVEK